MNIVNGLLPMLGLKSLSNLHQETGCVCPLNAPQKPDSHSYYAKIHINL